MDNNFEIFEGKSYKDLLKEICVNSQTKKDQIDILIGELRPLVKTVDDATAVVPLIKEYLDVGVRNDEQLVKLAQIIQRLKSNEQMAAAESGDNVILSEEEKKVLMKNLDPIVKEIKTPILGNNNTV